MSRKRYVGFALMLCCLYFTAAGANPASDTGTGSTVEPQYSHRLIVELQDPALGQWSRTTGLARSAAGRLNMQQQDAQTQSAKLKAAQQAFMSSLQQSLPGASVASYRNEQGSLIPLRYSIVFNGFAIDPGNTSAVEAKRIIGSLQGVKRVYPDRAHYPTLYASIPLIKADTAWLDPGIGGQTNAGSGIKIASMDGGIHKDAPMFSGAGFTYPPAFPANGLGLTENNNGKIIASRTYFRDWDPPKYGDATTWPGAWGTPHGVHTSGIMAGNSVNANYLGLTVPMSGVAPAAWLMSYRVFYQSVTEDGSFYDAEGIAALEDIVKDGADVVNNSWGGGPSSVGGEFDALDTALRNAWDAGIFVVMSAGNSGPGAGTTDHPSSSYIDVAATTSGGDYTPGVKVSISAPVTVPDNLTNIACGTASFGPSLIGRELTFPLIAAGNVDSANILGCTPWTGTPFDNATALIARGTCNFFEKVYYAQQAGAMMVIIYNSAAGGDSTMNMGCTTYCNSITIPSVFIGQTNGLRMETWCDSHTADAEVQTNIPLPIQVGNTPDRVASFSSRGPGVGMTLKPDIAAPGVSILSQGYTDGVDGEARHLGFGEASGTSMAAPMVTGAAALLQQRYPTWQPAWIKSALMTTAKYLDIYTSTGLPAQPLDMGAGRIDVAKAFNPGVILDPPSVSYGMVDISGQAARTLTVSNITATQEIYTISTLRTAGGFPGTSPAPGVTVNPSSLTLDPGQTQTVEITFNAATGTGVGDNQGYVVFIGNNGHEAHAPFWARVKPVDSNKVLVVDNDASASVGGASSPDYLAFYTQALDNLTIDYDVLDVDNLVGSVGATTFLPAAAELAAYDAIIYFSGNNWYRNGSYSVPTPLTSLDMDRLTEYANSGGLVIASGQDFYYIANGYFFYENVLAGEAIRDSVSANALPDKLVVAPDNASAAFQGITIDLSGAGDGAANQIYVDELKADPFGYPGAPAYINSSTPLFVYQDNSTKPVVAMLHRDQPTLERPGISYYGRSVYLAFGLEGMNNDTGATTRQALLAKLLDWGRDEPAVNFTADCAATGACTFTASLTAPVAGTAGACYRWDFGDTTAFADTSALTTAEHQYLSSGSYTVRIEATDSFGNRAVSSQSVPVTIKTTPVCVDNDGDGYGDNCTAGPDCNDNDSFYNEICPACTVKIIPKTLGWLVGDKEKTRSLLIIGNRGTDFGDNPTVKWESDAIDVISTRVLFKRFMFMRAKFNGEPLEKQDYRVIVGECEGIIKWAR